MSKRKGKVYRYEDLEFYACDGVVCIINTKDENPEQNMETASPIEFVKRAIAVHFKWSENKAPSELSKTSKLLEDALSCAKEAHKQTQDLAEYQENKKMKIFVPVMVEGIKNLEPFYNMTPEEAKKRLLEMIKRNDPMELLKKGLN
ncbi:MAG: hypothetical protein QW727_04330 [Candidatus Pacearchaeota archaeon]